MPCWTGLFLSLTFGSFLAVHAQSSATNQASQAQQAEPQILSSYEGQTVSSIDIAGRPDLDMAQFKSSFVQQQGQPFSREQVNQTAAALKMAGSSTRFGSMSNLNRAESGFNSLLNQLSTSGFISSPGRINLPIRAWCRLPTIQFKRRLTKPI